MPQDSLTQVLLGKALQNQGPEQALPETLSPEQSAQQGPFVHGLDKAMDFLLSAGGVRRQKPGDWATGLGAAAGAVMGAPKLPFGMAAQGVEEAGGGLSPLLRKIFASNPEAEGAYGRAMATQLPQAIEAKQAAGAARYADQARAHDALLDLDISGRPHPIPTDTGFATAIPLQEGPQAAPQAIAKAQHKSFSTTHLSPEMLNDIKNGDPSTVSKRYPEIYPVLLHKIMNGTVTK